MSTPTFPKRDPGEPEFWDLRYEASFVPWDAGKVPAGLTEFARSWKGGRDILVPGCGSAVHIDRDHANAYPQSMLFDPD